MLKNCKTIFCWLWLSVIIIVIDQLTKYIAMRELVSYEPLSIFSSFNFNLMFNPGMAFSLFDNAYVGINSVFIIIAFIVCGIIIAIFKLQQALHPLYYAALALIMGGAIGNVIDRIRLGFVVDFLDFHIANYHWPAFNVADSAICVGAVLLIVEIFLNKKA